LNRNRSIELYYKNPQAWESRYQRRLDFEKIIMIDDESSYVLPSEVIKSSYVKDDLTRAR